MERRELLKLGVFLPATVISHKSEAFFQGLIVRFLFGHVYRAVARQFAKKVVERQIKSRILSVPQGIASTGRVRARAYTGIVKAEDKEKKINEIVSNLETARRVAELTVKGYKLWSKNGKNTTSVVLANPTDKAITTEPMLVKLGAAGDTFEAELGEVYIPAGGVTTAEIDFEEMGFVADNMSIQQIRYEGKAMNIVDRLNYLPAKTYDNLEDKYKSESQASKIFEEYLGDV